MFLTAFWAFISLKCRKLSAKGIGLTTKSIGSRRDKIFLTYQQSNNDDYN